MAMRALSFLIYSATSVSIVRNKIYRVNNLFSLYCDPETSTGKTSFEIVGSQIDS